MKCTSEKMKKEQWNLAFNSLRLSLLIAIHTVVNSKGTKYSELFVKLNLWDMSLLFAILATMSNKQLVIILISSDRLAGIGII